MAEVVRIPTRLAQDAEVDGLFGELGKRIGRADRIEAAVRGYVEHVQAREVAGWSKTPMGPSVHGKVGLAQLVEALES